MKKALYLFTGFSVLISCAGLQPRQITSLGEVRIIEAKYMNLFTATKEFLQERGYEVIKTNSENGEIETDYKHGVGWSAPEYKNAEQRARFSAKVIKMDENHSKLSLEILSQVRELGAERINYQLEIWRNPSYEIPKSDWQKITGGNREARIMYDQFFKGIVEKVNRIVKNRIIGQNVLN